MVCSEFDVIMKQYMDFSDRNTVKMLSEATADNQTQILTALTSKLYDLIVAKADKIDYSTISKSKGDITKVQNYDQLVECIDLIRKIVVEYKQPTTSVDIVYNAMGNVKSRTDLFRKSFGVNSPIPVMTYNNVVLAIVNSTSFMIATCIEYVKTPKNDSFDMALDKVAYSQTMNHSLFKSLALFNEACKSNEFDNTMKMCISKRIIKEAQSEIDIEDDTPFLTPDEIDKEEDVDGKKVIVHDIKLNEGLIESTLGGVARGLVFIIKVIVPLLRGIVYYVYSTRQTIYDYFTVQAQMLEMNAYQLQYNNELDEETKKKAIEKQTKIATKFRNIANKFAIENSVASKNAEKMKDEDDDKYSSEEMAGEIVDNNDDTIF